VIHHPSLRLLSTRERQRIHTRSKRRKRIVGQLDPICQVGRKKHQRLLGGVAVGNHGGDADRAHVNRPAIVRPNQRGIVRRVSAIGKLDDHAKLDRPSLQTRLELFSKKIGRLGFGVRLAQVLLTGNGKKLVASRLLDSLLVDENECVVGEVGFGAVVAGTAWVSCTNFKARGCEPKNASTGQG
jgi:hypothetical protein